VRLHPAVAVALLLVGGALLMLPLGSMILVPLFDWLHGPRNNSPSSPPIPWLLIGFISCPLGLAFIFVAVIFSFETRSAKGGTNHNPPAG
jgi:hypothetical protein